MNRRIFLGALPLTLGMVPRVWEQSLPDFSGIWILTPSRSDSNPYGQLRVIRQDADAVDFTAIQYAGEPSIPGLHVIPWKLRFNRWGPRRGGENSREPKVQARWDGNKLIYVKSPGESFSVLFIWSLEHPDELLVEGVNWTSIPSSFDFKERSIPSAYARTRHYYRRVADVIDWSPEPDGRPVTLRLKQNDLSVTCRVTECRSYEIASGRRISMRSHASGSVLSVSLAAQTTIELSK